MAVITGNGNDNNLLGTAEADTINGLGGDDRIDALTRPPAGGIDVADGGNGIDTLIVNAGGESQAVQLHYGGSPTYGVFSDSGAIRVDAYSMERVEFTGGAGNDHINTGERGGTVNGGGGIDHWLANLGALFGDVDFELGATSSILEAGLSGISAIDRISLATGAGDDRLTGGDHADTINGGDGDDVINAKGRSDAIGGLDVIDGAADFDTLVVNASAETQAVQLSAGGAPSFSVTSDSNNLRVDAYNIEAVRFTGGAGNDTINTGTVGGTVNGQGGNDHWLANLSALSSGITFNVAATTQIAAAGLTSILGLERISLTTGSGDDTITGGALADTINTGDGNDTINAKNRAPAAGLDIVDGGRGTDLLIVNAASERKAVTLSAGGAPTFSVTSESERFRVDAYNIERIDFTGGTGNDTVNTADRAVEVHGGGGIDQWIADYSAVSADVVFDVAATAAILPAGLVAISGFERINLTTGGGDDTITGGAQGDRINTGAGNDTINAKTRPAAGDLDIVDGGLGLDTLIVNASADTLGVELFAGGAPSYAVQSADGKFRIDAYNVERVDITGGNGNDTFNTGAGGIRVDGRGGIDHWLADISTTGADITFILGTTGAIAAAGLTSIARIERLTLTTGGGDDTITGGSHADTISTGNGDDTVNMLDRLLAGGGFDLADGGNGNDRLIVDASAETQAVQLFAGGAPSLALHSGSGKFRADAYNFESADFRSGSGNDLAQGGVLGDRLFMGSGDDSASGNRGNDTIRGDAGADTIRGGRGADTLTGGSEADLFIYDSVAESRVATSEVDTITDFVSTVDKIDLAALDADGFGNTGDQAFTFIGGGAFSGARGELRSVGGRIEADINGDRVADFQILFGNGAAAAAGDIVL